MPDRVTVVINLKHYSVASGPMCERFLSKFIGMDFPENIDVIFALNPIDLRIAKNFPELKFFSQHVDPVTYGASTGQISVESLLDLGISGTLLNHSEKRMDYESIAKVMDISGRHDFPAIICAENPDEAEKYAKLGPLFVAYEPPELIGGNISVTSAKPEIIGTVVDKCSGTGVSVLVGAGVKGNADLKKSLELGAKGVLIASGIVLSSDPLSSLSSLIEKL